MIRPELLEPFARATVTALGVGVLESAALAAFVWAMTLLRPRPSATTRHVLWWLTLTAAVALPLVSLIGSLGHIERHTVLVQRASNPSMAHLGAAFAPDASSNALPANALSAPAATRNLSHDGALAARSKASRRLSSSVVPGLAAGPAAALKGPDWWARVRAGLVAFVQLPLLGLGLLALWLVVAAIGCASLVRSLLALQRIKRNALPLDENVVRRLRRWRHSARAGRSVQLAVSNEVDVPVAVGFRTPTILFPIQVVETEDIADLDQIAMHEYAHLDRYDDWTNLIQRVLERIFWFNPILQLVGHRISLEREISCDDWVVAQTGRAHRYATCLWKLVEASRLPAKPILAPGALLSPRQLTTRIEQLLDARRNALPRLSPFGTLCVALLCIAAIVAQVQRAPVIALTEVKLAPAGHPALVAQATVPAANPAVISNPAPEAKPAPATHPQANVRVLPRLEALPKLDKLPKLDTLQKLDKLPKIEALPKLPKIEALPKLDKLPTLATLRTLPTLQQLPALPKLQKLSPLPALRNLPNVLGDKSVLSIVVNGKDFMRAPLLLQNLPKSIVIPSIADGKHIEIAIDQAAIDRANQAAADAARDATRAAAAAERDATRAGAEAASDATRAGAEAARDATRAAAEATRLAESRARAGIRNCTGCDFRGLNFSGADVRRISLTGVDLRSADLHGAMLPGARLVGVELRGADLRGIDLSGAELIGVDLRNANLSGANLHNAILRGCDLHGVNFSKANLSGASIDAPNMSFIFHAPRMWDRFSMPHADWPAPAPVAPSAAPAGYRSHTTSPAVGIAAVARHKSKAAAAASLPSPSTASPQASPETATPDDPDDSDSSIEVSIPTTPGH